MCTLCPPTPTHPTLHITLKLTRDNYLSGKAQLLPYLCGQKLFGLVNGSKPAPPTTLQTTSTDIPRPNPGYEFWYEQDQLILSTLISSLSKPILTYLVGLETSRDVWFTLEKMFSTTSQARQMNTLYQLNTLKKGGLSI
ncbi:hypothetical protein F2P56_024000 [Juglans regia]|uniref:Retrovirus-related Pol polyprotein from transposon TNT 1-94 n=1 Tax=Juglans regia TaxID=51240 RepID=A0A833X0E8_JUGRE|nr:hypothetical protein F2P56_024000 [Juglans regia]